MILDWGSGLLVWIHILFTERSVWGALFETFHDKIDFKEGNAIVSSIADFRVSVVLVFLLSFFVLS